MVYFGCVYYNAIRYVYGWAYAFIAMLLDMSMGYRLRAILMVVVIYINSCVETIHESQQRLQTIGQHGSRRGQ